MKNVGIKKTYLKFRIWLQQIQMAKILMSISFFLKENHVQMACCQPGF